MKHFFLFQLIASSNCRAMRTVCLCRLWWIIAANRTCLGVWGETSPNQVSKGQKSFCGCWAEPNKR